MHTIKTLKNQLSDLKINPAGTLLVHSAYKCIGEVDGRADTVLDALMEYMEAGTLLLPSHTWDNVKKGTNPVMDVLHTPSCVGILTEIFRNRAGVRRSLHPTHSLSATGKDAEEILAGEEKINTPCGKDGAYYKLWERNAQILLIGVNFGRNTFIHGIEEWDNAEGFISTQITDLYTIDYNGNRLHTPQYRHNSRLGSDTFVKLEPQAIQEGILSLGRFGDATARVMYTQPLRKMVAEIIKTDALYLQRF